jgi:hypothetical protein
MESTGKTRFPSGESHRKQETRTTKHPTPEIERNDLVPATYEGAEEAARNPQAGAPARKRRKRFVL